jgi:hypothetical protein
MGTDGADMFHLPRAGLVTICTRGQRSNGTDINAHTAFFALEMLVLVGHDELRRIAVGDSQRPDIHALAADAHAAITHDAAWPVEIHYRGPLLFIAMVLEINEFGFRRPISQCCILQFALSSGIADRSPR